MRYLGKKFGEEKNAIFADAEIFIHPTMEDCFPLVLLEAMSYGLPIVTTNEGGIPDIVNDGENGIICTIRNADSFAVNIARLLEDTKLRKKMGLAGNKILNEKLTERHFERKMQDCLRQALEN